MRPVRDRPTTPRTRRSGPKPHRGGGRRGDRRSRRSGREPGAAPPGADTPEVGAVRQPQVAARGPHAERGARAPRRCQVDQRAGGELTALSRRPQPPRRIRLMAHGSKRPIMGAGSRCSGGSSPASTPPSLASSAAKRGGVPRVPGRERSSVACTLLAPEPPGSCGARWAAAGERARDGWRGRAQDRSQRALRRTDSDQPTPTGSL